MHAHRYDDMFMHICIKYYRAIHAKHEQFYATEGLYTQSPPDVCNAGLIAVPSLEEHV